MPTEDPTKSDVLEQNIQEGEKVESETLAEALANYDRVLELAPNHVAALVWRHRLRLVGGWRKGGRKPLLRGGAVCGVREPRFYQFGMNRSRPSHRSARIRSHEYNSYWQWNSPISGGGIIRNSIAIGRFAHRLGLSKERVWRTSLRRDH
jgi:hypothetical protein